MIKVVNPFIPFKGFSCMTVLIFLFVRSEYAGRLSDRTLNHERIHAYQQVELALCGLILALAAILIWGLSWWWLLGALAYPLVLYVLSWLLEVLLPPYDTAYRDTCFERQAYANEGDFDYCKHWKPFSYFGYVLKDRK